MASSQSVNSDGLVASKENLKQNVLLATSGTIDVKNAVGASKVDLSSQIDENVNNSTKDRANGGFWQNLIKFRRNFGKSSKNSEKYVGSTESKCSENINSSRIFGSVASIPSTKKHQLADAEKCQIQNKETQSHSLDNTGDCISELIGHIGLWQVVWVIFLILFQVPSAFHIFSFMFQVSCSGSAFTYISSVSF